MPDSITTAILAIQNGQFAEGRRILIKIVTADPGHEQAWLWLAECMSPPAERMNCLERAATLNPLNAKTAQALQKMRSQAQAQPAGNQFAPEAPPLTSVCCPSCGASVAAAATECLYCGSHFVRPAAPAAPASEPALREFRCAQCQVTYFTAHAQLAITKCPNCFSPVTAQTGTLHQPSGRLAPFRLRSVQAEKKLLEWLAHGRYTPADIFTASSEARLTPLYLPFADFTGQAHIHWTVSVGYRKTETHTKIVKKTLYEKGERVERMEPEEQTRTVTNWHPFPGQAVVDVHFFRGLTRQKQLAGMFGQVLATTLTDHPLADLTATQLESGLFEALAATPENLANGLEAQQAVRSIMEKEARRRTPGDDLKDLSVSGQPKLNVQPIYLPYWFAQYVYAGQLYVAVLDDHNADRLQGGRPADQAAQAQAARWKKASLASLLAGLVLGGLGLLGFPSASAHLISIYLGGLCLLAAIGLYGWGWRIKNELVQALETRRRQGLSRQLASGKRFFR